MLTKEQILDAAEEVLRRFGPRKTTVVDVARVLNVSHGTVYRHFASKADLHEAIIQRWLARVTAPLTDVTKAKSKADKRLKSWFETLIDIKKRKVKDAPEMFESYVELAKNTPEHLKFQHIGKLLQQIESILIEGVQDGVFAIEDTSATARSFFFGTVRYHHPLHANEWGDEHIKEDFDQQFSLMLKAITKS
ncbi:TetR family transcriptional regulator [Shewanella frigidimarina]|uniref:TetR family transcriptional regulator n=1 Tax=Shewanella frigidimarina TaxID=56812 RepID=UPI003D7B1854